MNYKKLLVYAPTKAIFETALANSVADQNCVAYIEEPRMIWAQGNYYPCPYTKEEIDQLIQNNKDEFEQVIAELKGNVTEEYNTLEKIENKIKEEVSRAQQKETELDTKIEAETTRAQDAENALDQKLDEEIERAKAAESALDQKLGEEIDRAKEAEQTLTEGLDDANESIQDIRDTYLPLAGGTMTGAIKYGITNIGDGSIVTGSGNIASNMSSLGFRSDGMDTNHGMEERSIALFGSFVESWGTYGAGRVGLNIAGPENKKTAYTLEGVYMNDKTSTDLLTANGGTINIDDKFNEELSGYLPLSGGTITGDLTLTGDLVLNKGLLVNDGGALFTANVRVFSGNNSQLSVTGNTTSLGTPGVSLKGTGQIQVGYINGESDKLSINKDGITIPNKTATDLLNAAGGTVAIADLAGNYVTLDTSQTITGPKNFAQGVLITSRVTESTPEDIIIGAQLATIANSSIRINVAETDNFRIFTGGSSDKGFAVIASGDNGSTEAEPIFVAQTNTETATITKLITLMDTTGNQKFNKVTATGYIIEDKTANDILTANGSTTVLKTIGGESLLGEGNIELATNGDIDALFGVIDTGDE